MHCGIAVHFGGGRENNPLAVLGQGIFLIGVVFGHMHVKAGVVFLGQGNRLLQEFLTDGKRGMQPHVALIARCQKGVGLGRAASQKEDDARAVVGQIGAQEAAFGHTVGQAAYGRFAVLEAFFNGIALSS